MDKCAAACALENSKLFEGIGEEDIRHMMECSGAVSYTHLTLPTILRV